MTEKERATLRRGTRRGARGNQDGGALGRKGAFVSLVAWGPPERLSRVGVRVKVEDTGWFLGLQIRP